MDFEVCLQLCQSPTVRVRLINEPNYRLAHLNVHRLCFLSLPDRPSPTIALIHSDHLGRKVLCTHTVDLAGKDLAEGPVKATILEDAGSELLIPVQGEEGAESGVLVVGEEKLLWVSLGGGEEDVKGKGKQGAGKGEGNEISARLPVGLYTSSVLASFPQKHTHGLRQCLGVCRNRFCAADDERDKFFVSDLYGLLQTITVVRSSGGKVVSLDVRDVGQVRHSFAGLLWWLLLTRVHGRRHRP
jgi:hypothetical protein